MKELEEVSNKPIADSTGLFALLEGLLRLPAGWDSYRAPAPTIAAVSNARRFLRTMLDGGLCPSSVDASAVGGVAITVRRGGRKGYAEFYNDAGAVLLLADDGSEELATRDLATTTAAYSEAIREIREYVDG